MNAPLTAARCLNHVARPAAGHCLECTRAFCRECLTEHGGRLTCLGCLRARAKPETSRRSRLLYLAPPLLAVGALIGSWLFFYVAGVWLESLSAPAPAAASRSG